MYKIFNHGIVINGDCDEWLLRIKSDTVRLVLNDPPYGTTGHEWDIILDHGKIWKELKRIRLSKNTIVSFGAEPFSSFLRMSNKQEYKYDWKWVKEKATLFLQAKNRPMRKYEDILIFSSNSTNHESKSGSNRQIYNPQGLVRLDKVISLARTKRNKDAGYHGELQGGISNQEYTNYPTDVLYYAKDKVERHPAQKPQQLLQYLINTYSYEKDIVLDFTAGSGSTGIAAMLTNRYFILIERDKVYYDAILGWFNEYYQGLFSNMYQIDDVLDWSDIIDLGGKGV